MLLRSSVVLVALIALAVGAAGVFVRGSLPTLDGELGVAGLADDVAVERDSLGVAWIRATTRDDAAFALGFVHAQERFFQMDLLRRAAAGELAELLGADLLSADRVLRPHRFRARAQTALATLSPRHRALLDAYVTGANTGLGALSARPWEYGVLRQAPRAWAPEDPLLVAYAMTLDLQRGQTENELEEDAEARLLPNALDRFLDPLGDAWDAPLVGDAFTPPGVPPADSLRGWTPTEAPTLDAAPEREPVKGSNNWAVSGARTRSGGAMVANDMHLGLRLPNIWYRAALSFTDETGERTVAGVTLPGTPLLIVGSTGRVAWGFTNSYGDWTDLVRLIPDGRPGWVRTDTGAVRLDTLRETLRVAGGDAETLDVVESPWGPVMFDADGQDVAVQWTAHLPGAVSLDLFDLERAATLDEAAAVANRSGIPAQNIVIADADGRVGWTIAGRVPDRRGRTGRRSVASTDPDALWRGWRDPAATPRVLDPADGLLWTANARVVGGDDLAALGIAGWAHGARARQIRDALRAHDGPFTERDLFAIQLDDRAVYLERWQALLLRVLDDRAVQGRPDRAALRARVEAWGARASADSPGYGPVRSFHDGLRERLSAAYVQPVRGAGHGPDIAESALWTIVSERPAAFLPRGETSWRDVLLDAADAAADAPATWGEQTRAAIAHPLADALPVLGDRLRMPADPLSGDGLVPRVQRSDFGASERMVVSPGREADGILHMPGGQAGHPLSPYWGAGHDAWVEGRPLPFLPGSPRWTLTLVAAD